ncbi:putative phage-tail assembly protein [Hafnia paralvei ATCC 29927]|nr:putative phage-tail assembly protein [Hafnia paralvei ATCC 29927]
MRGLFHIYCRINPTALVALSLLGAYSAGYCDTDKSWQLKWTPCDKEDSEAIVQRQEDEGNKRLKADAIDAQRPAVRLREQLAQFRQQFADSETGKLSSAVSSSAAKFQTIILLTQLLSESNEAAREYAKEADRAYSAG